MSPGLKMHNPFGSLRIPSDTGQAGMLQGKHAIERRSSKLEPPDPEPEHTHILALSYVVCFSHSPRERECGCVCVCVCISLSLSPSEKRWALNNTPFNVPVTPAESHVKPVSTKCQKKTRTETQSVNRRLLQEPYCESWRASA